MRVEEAREEQMVLAEAPNEFILQRRALIDHVLRNTEDVGTQFAEQARKMHYEEAPARAIRGVTTPQEAEDLREEGIEVLPLPIPSRNDWN